MASKALLDMLPTLSKNLRGLPRVLVSDSDYIERRAEQELDLSQRSAHPNVVKAHYLLPSFYLDRLYNRLTAGKADFELINECQP